MGKIGNKEEEPCYDWVQGEGIDTQRDEQYRWDRKMSKFW